MDSRRVAAHSSSVGSHDKLPTDADRHWNPASTEIDSQPETIGRDRSHSYDSSSTQSHDQPRTNSTPNTIHTVQLFNVPIVALNIDRRLRLCLAQISSTLLKDFSYNEIHNRRVALGINCVQCTPVQLEILRRAGAMPISSRRCGMITKREAERLVKSFLCETKPPALPDDFAFQVQHACSWGCLGKFIPSRYNSSRAKCIQCIHCQQYFSPNKFIFHSHKLPDSVFSPADAANFNSWRRHIRLTGSATQNEDLVHAWEDVKAMFNGGSRRRILTPSSNIVRKYIRTGRPPTSSPSSSHHRSSTNRLPPIDRPSPPSSLAVIPPLPVPPTLPVPSSVAAAAASTVMQSYASLLHPAASLFHHYNDWLYRQHAAGGNGGSTPYNLWMHGALQSAAAAHGGEMWPWNSTGMPSHGQHHCASGNGLFMDRRTAHESPFTSVRSSTFGEGKKERNNNLDKD